MPVIALLAAQLGSEEGWTLYADAALQLALGLAIAFAAHALLFRALRLVAQRTAWKSDELIVRRLKGPTRFLLLGLALLFPYPAVARLPFARSGFAQQGIALAVIALVTWLVLALVRLGADVIKQGHRIDVADNLEARRVHTQVDVLARTVYVLVVLIGVAVALMTFPKVRELGASLLASAGVAGLVIGLSARPVLENLINGLQLAFTQPIRIDDVVIVEGEWGRIEEITATYVVVRIWDERRLIVPFSTFIHQPFQNWTRESAQIMGTVVLHTDFTVSVDAVRAELERVVKDHEAWDGRVCVLQVTDSNDRTMQLRALVSGADSSEAWNLRVHVRERLIAFLQREYPAALPRTRVELGGATEEEAASAAG